MPGLVPGIHGTPTERQRLLNSFVFPQSVRRAAVQGVAMTECAGMMVSSSGDRPPDR
jgi:hypothetical protein